VFCAAGAAPAAENGGWSRALERASAAVVTLRVAMPRSFDDQSAGYQTATGFVVDAKRGLILTNRHVVTPGPVVAEAILLNNEEIPLRVVYRDPVHDFGFFRFDPEDVRFMQLQELPLSPERARVGTEIRVLGNDAGEKLSILSGTLARLDRSAPPYGPSGYNDFNTFYYQAASSTSGGSSGAPVIDIDGHVLALNAGANRSAATSFFLPLDRVVRVLEALRRDQPVARGTLETVFDYQPYDELRRLGLTPESEARVRKRFPEASGQLVVREVIPGGPADGKLEPGDVLLSVSGQPLASFVPLEERLDASVGQRLEVSVERGGERRQVELSVADLHALTPSRYFEAGGGVFNPLSYQVARNYSLPVRGVFVAQAGYSLRRAGVPAGSILTQIGEQPIVSLDDFASGWEASAHGERVRLRYFLPQNPRVERVAAVTVDRVWFATRRCREQLGRAWECDPETPAPQAAATAASSGTQPDWGDALLERVAPSLVSVAFDIPYPLDGVHGTRFQGTGLILDAERGLVVVDRETVPIALGDIELTFAGSIRVAGELVALHPEHDLALIRYDPRSIGSTPVRSAVISASELRRGDRVWLVGLTARDQPVSRESSVSRLEPLELPLLRTPRFREMNLEVISLTDAIPTTGGVLTDRRGRVRALWASFSRGSGKDVETLVRGIPIARVSEMLERMGSSGEGVWRSLGIEWRALSLADARDLGLSEELAQGLTRSRDALPQVLSVSALEAGSSAARVLREGDVLLSIGGNPATRFEQVERASQVEEVELELWREGSVLRQSVQTLALDGRGSERALVWAGAVLQRPPRAIALQRGVELEGVYVSFYFFGSPANRFGLRPTRRIVSVDGVPTPDLERFEQAVASLRDRNAVRLEILDLEGRRRVQTLQLDLVYWPTEELVRGEAGWQRRSLPSGGEPPPEQSALYHAR